MPAQNLSSGYVHIEILEAYVAQVNVIGKTNGLEEYIDAYAQQLKTLQHYILLLNRLPSVSASLKKSPEIVNSGAKTLTFVIKKLSF